MCPSRLPLFLSLSYFVPVARAITHTHTCTLLLFPFLSLRSLTPSFSLHKLAIDPHLLLTAFDRINMRVAAGMLQQMGFVWTKHGTGRNQILPHIQIRIHTRAHTHASTHPRTRTRTFSLPLPASALSDPSIFATFLPTQTWTQDQHAGGCGDAPADGAARGPSMERGGGR